MEISTGLKVLGATLTALGSLFLGWRAYQISKFVKSVLDAHEISLHALVEILETGKNTVPVLVNMGKHYEDYEKKAGLKLVIMGFAFLALGAIINASSYFV